MFLFLFFSMLLLCSFLSLRELFQVNCVVTLFRSNGDKRRKKRGWHKRAAKDNVKYTNLPKQYFLDLPSSLIPSFWLSSSSLSSSSADNFTASPDCAFFNISTSFSFSSFNSLISFSVGSSFTLAVVLICFARSAIN